MAILEIRALLEGMEDSIVFVCMGAKELMTALFFCHLQCVNMALSSTSALVRSVLRSKKQWNSAVIP